MKKNIHPEYQDTVIKCSCGSEFHVRSNKSEIHVENCSKCHPFYTGVESRNRAAGRVDKFNKKYGFDKKGE